MAEVKRKLDQTRQREKPGFLQRREPAADVDLPHCGQQGNKAHDYLATNHAASTVGPKAIAKVFAARHVSRERPDLSGYAADQIVDLMFVDVESILRDGKHYLHRTLVIKTNDGKWYIPLLALPTGGDRLQSWRGNCECNIRERCTPFRTKHDFALAGFRLAG